MQNAATEKYRDRNSIDIGFHFPDLNFPCQCRSILMQVRFHEGFPPEKLKAVGIEMSGYEPSYPLWQFSTIGSWQFEGDFPPTIRTQKKLKQVCYRILQLFGEKEQN